MIIADNIIHSINGLYSANDLHKASGAKNKHSPFRFMRLASTRTLINEIERSPHLVSVSNGKAYRVNTQGTWICKELVYAYAMWISPRFNLLVISAFDSLVRQQNSLTYRLNNLCNDLKILEIELSKAGRFLSIGGLQIKPKLKQAIGEVVNEMQLQLPLERTDNLSCQRMTNYLDQDTNLNALDNDLLHGDLGGDADE